MRPLLVLVAACSVALAGCASSPDAERPVAATPTAPSLDPAQDEPLDDKDTDKDVDDAAPRAPGTTFLNGTVTAVAAANEEPVGLCCPTLAQTGENLEGAFDPGEGVTGIVIELLWTDPTFDLDLALMAPDHEFLALPEVNGTSLTSSRGHVWWEFGGQTGAPDQHTTIAVTDPEVLAIEGEWSWSLSTKSANNVAFTVAVTLFYDAPPPDGFSAFAA